jgi:hypothetical protein
LFYACDVGSSGAAGGAGSLGGAGSSEPKESGPNLLAPEVPLMQAHTNRTRTPITVRKMKNQAPDLSRSCILLQKTASPGMNKTNIVIIPTPYQN